uniref:Carbohydrate sulfotransferase 6 n=1 Tax=Lepisosteus oculatus TaxID=7918 RepID=W5M5A8_LEPOC
MNQVQWRGRYPSMPRIKCTVPTMVMVVLLQSGVLVFLFTWHGPLVSPVPEPQGKVHVLILSSWRSGSSFVGQVFSQHPDVFYLMEPAWHVWANLYKHSAAALRMAVRDLIHSVFQCDASVFDAYLSGRHNISNIFMWEVSRALCSQPACSLYSHSNISSDPELCRKTCGRRDLEVLEETCKSYSHVVLKEVRFFDIKSLYPLFRDPSLNLKIIHLIRDPRAVVRSREQSMVALMRDNGIVLNSGGTGVADPQYKVMQEICRSHIQIYETATQKAPEFLKGRYMMVRYEDLVRDPLAQISQMYKFTELEMTSKLRNWIYKVTHGQGSGKQKEAFKITSRNAVDVSQAWRSSLPHDKVRKIQEVCKGAMNLLGYRLVESEAEQRMMALDVVVPQEHYQFSWLPSKTTEGEKV